MSDKCKCEKCNEELPDHLTIKDINIPTDKEYIKTFFHCRKCLEQMPPDITPQNYAKLEMGFTDIGFQVWCIRHDCNVVHIDFEKMVHPFND